MRTTTCKWDEQGSDSSTKAAYAAEKTSLKKLRVFYMTGRALAGFQRVEKLHSRMRTKPEKRMVLVRVRKALWATMIDLKSNPFLADDGRRGIWRGRG